MTTLDDLYDLYETCMRLTIRLLRLLMNRRYVAICNTDGDCYQPLKVLIQDIPTSPRHSLLVQSHPYSITGGQHGDFFSSALLWPPASTHRH